MFIGVAVGAVVSAAYNDLYSLAKEAVAAAAWCKKYCRELAKDLELLRPLFHGICSAMDQDPQFHLPWRQRFLAFKDRLEEGKTLVEDCLRLHRLDLFRRHRYGKSILKLEKDISSFVQQLAPLNTHILLQQHIRSVQHKDRLDQVAQTQHDFGQAHTQQLQDLARDQVQLAQEQDLHLQQLSQQQKDQFGALAKEHKSRSDELKETVDLAIEKIIKQSTSPAAIAASLQQLGRLVLNDTSNADGQQTSGLQDTLMMPKFVVGIERPLMEVKEQLLAKKQSVMIVGVKGMGGIGKTTLAVALCHDAEIQACFTGGIHFVTVSQSPNMLELFKELWEKLIGGSRPWFQNEEDALRQLQRAIRRMESPVLLVLDDVWSRAHLEKLAFEGDQCRILFTTRQASTLPVRNASLYELGLLSEEHALRLFCFWAFGQESIPEWEDASMVMEVQDECKRLPLALKVIGGSLFGQPAIAWQNAKKRLRQAQTIGDYHTDALFKCLQTSFDVLDVQLQQCFIDLGSFPEDKEIPVHVLFDIWMNVRGMDWDDAVMALVELSSRCLVDVINSTFSTNMLVYGSAQEIRCHQHDVMRDLALYLGRKASVPNSKSLAINHEDLQPDLRKWLLMPHKEPKIPGEWRSYNTKSCFTAEIISINTDAVAKQDWPHGINFSATQALLIYTDGDRYALPQFVESMSELKMLMVQSSSACNCTGFEALNSLINLQSIHLQRLSNDVLPECFRSLKKLRKLHLFQCLGFNTMNGMALNSSCHLTDFTLRGCKRLKDVIDETCVLPSLERMFLDNCSALPKLPDDIGQNLSNLVLLSLRYCTRLKALPDSLCKLKQLQHLDISGCENIKSLPKDIGQLSNLKDLRLRQCESLKALPSSVTQLQSLENLILPGCKALENLPEDFGKLSKLQKLEFQFCKSLQTLPSSIMELRALRAMSCDEKWAAQLQAMKDHLVQGLVMEFLPTQLDAVTEVIEIIE